MSNFSVDLHFSQQDMFELIDTNEWVMIDNVTTGSGFYHATFSTPTAMNDYNFQNMELSPELAKELIKCSSKFEICAFDDGRVEIVIKDEETKDFISKNKNKFKIVL